MLITLDVEEEMRRQWDLLSGHHCYHYHYHYHYYPCHYRFHHCCYVSSVEEKAYYEEALLQMEREKHKNDDEECSPQQVS